MVKFIFRNNSSEWRQLMTRSLRWFMTALFLLLSTAPVLAQERTKPSLDQVMHALKAVRTFKGVAVSPDGHFVAWVQAVHGQNPDQSSHSAIYVANLNIPGKEPVQISAGNGHSVHAEQEIAWSPDSRKIAFLSDKEATDQFQIYVAPAEGGPARKLTNVVGLLTSPSWSPDGKQIAVLFTENAPRAAGPLQPGAVETGVIGEHIDEQRLSVVDVQSSQLKPISPADMYVYEYDWSPDGTQFATIAAFGSGDNNWFIAQLYTLALSTGQMKSILKPPLQIAVPRWSPDGKSIAYIGGLMSDEGANGGDVFVIASAGGEPRDVTPKMKASASSLAWAPSSKEILFAENIDGCSGIGRVDLASGNVTTLWQGPESIFAQGWGPDVSLSRDLQVSGFVRSSFEHPFEVWAGPIGRWRQITHANKDLRPSWGKVESIHWKSDEVTVQGWLLYPRDYQPDRRYPMVVSVHGGPASSRNPSWPGRFFEFSLLSAEGYFVLFPNPRGSYGQGETFTQANVKDFGYGDLRDILAGVDQVVKTLPVDNDRVGIGGWSYGGYMTMWTVTQTSRFRTAVAGAGIANWQSYYGQNGIDQWMIPYFGASVYDDPAVYAKSSPITFIKQVKTPTLILVGDRDVECPVPQSYEFWHALKTLKVPTQFVVYPEEGHSIGKPAHRRDIMQRTVAWFNKYLQPGTTEGSKTELGTKR
jgi:dipeptidyl aminopeptidase/acylaminoacyl peptidase